MKHIQEKLATRAGAVSGGASILGSWQVCHNVCLGIIAVFAALGVTVVGMPLAFLTRYSVPMWSLAFVLLLVTLWFYIKKKCISSRLVLFNAGLITAGVPFSIFYPYSLFFWTVGGAMAFVAIALFIRDRLNKRDKHEK